MYRAQKSLWAATAVLVLAIILSVPAMADEVQIDCYDANLLGQTIENTGTNNLISVSFWRKSTMKGQPDHMVDTVHKIPDCGEMDDERYHSGERKVDYVIIQTNGDDAFWMDEVYLDEPVTLANPVPDTYAHWGVDGKNGFCLSTDPNDGKGSWKDRVSGCHKAWRFDVASGRYRPTDPVKFTDAPKQWYVFNVDCYDSSMENESTKDTISVRFYSGKTLLGVDELSPVPAGTVSGFLDTVSGDERKLCNIEYDAAAIESANYNQKITSIVLETSGEDGFWIDRAYLEVLMDTPYGQISNMDFERRQLQSWGRQGGKGYCMSRDPEDGKRSWKKKVDGCHRKLKFSVTDDAVYPM